MKDLLEKNVQVKYNKQLSSLEVTFHGFVPYDTMVRALQHEYALIRHYRLKKCLVDLREMGIYAPGVSELIKNEWFPRVITEGVAYPPGEVACYVSEAGVILAGFQKGGSNC